MTWQCFLVGLAFIAFVVFFTFVLYKACSSQFDGMMLFAELKERAEENRRAQKLHTEYNGKRYEMTVGELEDVKDSHGLTTMVDDKGELCFAKPEDNPTFKEIELVWLPEGAYIREEKHQS